MRFEAGKTYRDRQFAVEARLIARRPGPDLEFFFNRYERRRQGMNRSDPGSRPDLHELESQARLQNRR